MSLALPILNADSATFECTFGRGCEGICCREGRPPVYPEEIAILQANLDRILPRLRPEARAAVLKDGFLAPRQRRLGQRILRVSQGWCVFFNEGCVLHQAGVEDGDKFRYKPSLCSLFPIQQDNQDRWYIRQKGFQRESWDLFCLDPCNTKVLASDSLRDEIRLAKRFDDEQKNTDAAPGKIASPES